jgi:hypothetical protein
VPLPAALLPPQGESSSFLNSPNKALIDKDNFHNPIFSIDKEQTLCLGFKCNHLMKGWLMNESGLLTFAV